MSGLAAPLSSASLEHPGKSSSYSSGNASGRSSIYGQAEEATIYTETRMLQDQTGRLRRSAHTTLRLGDADQLLVYIGDSSTLSILQLIRIIVESTAGPILASNFIHDPKRHRIMENIIDFPENTKLPCFLPDQETAQVLVESYFTNVSSDACQPEVSLIRIIRQGA